MKSECVIKIESIIDELRTLSVLEDVFTSQLKEAENRTDKKQIYKQACVVREEKEELLCELRKLQSLHGEEIKRIECNISDSVPAPYAECICVFKDKAIYLDEYNFLYVDRLLGENTKKGDVYPADVRQLIPLEKLPYEERAEILRRMGDETIQDEL